MFLIINYENQNSRVVFLKAWKKKKKIVTLKFSAQVSNEG